MGPAEKRPVAQRCTLHVPSFAHRRSGEGGAVVSVTMRDIAKKLKISHTTVSRALRDDTRISASTRALVKAEAERLGYRINAPARALASKRMRSIALVVPDVFDPFYAGVIAGVDQVTREHGYSLLLYISHSDPDRERSALAEAAERRYDGTILFRRHATAADLEVAVQRNIPIVLLTRNDAALPVDCVRVDDVDGGYRATSFLIALGHRRIGFIGGPADQYETQDRFAGYRQALEENGLEFDPVWVWPGGFSEADGRRAAEAIVQLPLPQRPTAVFAANDRMAIGLQKRLGELGISVPHEVSVIGYDDIEPCRYVVPALTTVRQPTHRMGAEAAELLIKRLSGEEFPPREIVLRTEVVVRDSCRSLTQDG